MGSVAKKGDVVTVIVAASIQDNGIDVTVQDGIPGFIRKTELSRDRRAASRPLRDRRQARRQDHQHRQGLAPRRFVKARNSSIDEEKKAMADFGSSDSGASLGDILGAALKKRAEADEEDK